MGFDHETVAQLVRGRSDRLRAFAMAAKRCHDDRESLMTLLDSLRRDLDRREAEIAMLKEQLLRLEGDRGVVE